ncbi:hypothetical protein [Sporomusa sp.]|jgi:hypothetical protein|uniref:hypothetical protein n=1 Tax=Sporomusa sp. TaxID=2078658 RepID=UPI002B760CB1|nr:hypothetical protein [Sporomusa sp.]HWR07868.1 hypothetical protein [Sporomusa sp.]
MKKEASQAGSKYVTDGSGLVEQGLITARILLSDALAKEKAKDNRVNIVCKADLISLSHREETRKSVALIDRLLRHTG